MKLFKQVTLDAPALTPQPGKYLGLILSGQSIAAYRGAVDMPEDMYVPNTDSPAICINVAEHGGTSAGLNPTEANPIYIATALVVGYTKQKRRGDGADGDDVVMFSSGVSALARVRVTALPSTNLNVLKVKRWDGLQESGDAFDVVIHRPFKVADPLLVGRPDGGTPVQGVDWEEVHGQTNDALSVLIEPVTSCGWRIDGLGRHVGHWAFPPGGGPAGWVSPIGADEP